MIEITDKSQCCGCTACANICPKQCITMKEDHEGFLYPLVDTSLCTDCNLCQKVCPVHNQINERKPLTAYAAKNKDEEIRLKSSSGGIFTLLAEKIIDENGVVFGARFDENWEVTHDYTKTKEGLAAFRGSKYVQSRMGNCYSYAKQFLDNGRKVLFTGTSCQIAGLKNFLRKDYDNLITVDVVCHGVPSPKVWRLYLKELITNNSKKKYNSPSSIHDGDVQISDISFRNKCSGWKNYSFAFTLSKSTTNRESKNTIQFSSVFTEVPYMNIFLSNLSLRLSCYACPAKTGKSQSDITIADFWGIEKVRPEFDDDKGISLVLIYTDKGRKTYDELLCENLNISYKEALLKNPSIKTSVTEPINRDFFFYLIMNEHLLSKVYKDCISTSITKRLRRVIYRKIGL